MNVVRLPEQSRLKGNLAKLGIGVGIAGMAGMALHKLSAGPTKKLPDHNMQPTPLTRRQARRAYRDRRLREIEDEEDDEWERGYSNAHADLPDHGGVHHEAPEGFNNWALGGHTMTRTSY